MKGRYVFWGVIASMALGLLVRYCYFSWENETVKIWVYAIFLTYLVWLPYVRIVEGRFEYQKFDVFIPGMWIVHLIRFINKLSDKYLTVEEKEHNK